jgi:hypothetical protein
LISQSKRDDFLSGLENWINEIVAKEADGHNEKIPGAIKDRFQKSMDANMTFHNDMATHIKGDGEDHRSLSRYHALMADIYKTFMC